MREQYRKDVILVSTSSLTNGRLDRAQIAKMNDILEGQGFGRPLSEVSPPEAPAGSRVIGVPLRSADPAIVSECLGEAWQRDRSLPECFVNACYGAGTEVRSFEVQPFEVQPFELAGKWTGHGVWWPLRPGTRLPARAGWNGARRPLVALLDTAVDHTHSWWKPGDIAEPDDGEDPWVGPTSNVTGPFHGHGTFVAGLIHQYSGAQILPVPVMDSKGAADAETVVKALEWLSRHCARPNVTVDVVCMAFGRRSARDDADVTHIAKVIAEVPATRIVASAGNNGSDELVFPAALARDANSKVVSVGAGESAERPDCYSNHGAWVKAWETGQAISIVDCGGHDRRPPRTITKGCDGEDYTKPDFTVGFARGKGTSFAAAIRAGKEALRIAQDNALAFDPPRS